MKSLEKLSDANVLVDAFKKASAGSIWKSSVQKYEINLLRNIRKTQTELLNGSYQQGDFLEFELNERGHNRRIKALGRKYHRLPACFSRHVLTHIVRSFVVVSIMGGIWTTFT